MIECIYLLIRLKGGEAEELDLELEYQMMAGWEKGEEAGEPIRVFYLCKNRLSLQSPQGGINMCDKGHHRENKIRIINFEPEENSLSNGKQKRRKILQKAPQNDNKHKK